ncbi:protein-disulfide isomerase [Oleiphilus messinensis]|uniref:Protein-disulfide isomerase n=1 Tax=Oleiphilus messinensis TaxID=141451 RepID=A0A1Y0IEP3_9GAMM|nr:thioredoxin domain-containing protein [Oleiphilus messinensis]ARU58740.1 protein-disulfide isomerase [Oleiphilus messinensis]
MTKNTSDTLRQRLLIAFGAFAVGMLVATTLTYQQSENSGTTDSPAVLLNYKGKDYRLDELPVSIALAYSDLEHETYENKQLLLIDAGLQLHVAQFARDKQLSFDEARQQLFSISPITEQAIEQFWKDNQEQIGQPFFAVKENIRQYLTQKQEQEKKNQIYSALTQFGDLTVLLPKPVRQKVDIDTEDYPTKGPEKAPLHIVEFADYQCPHCKTAFNTLNQLIEQYPEAIKLTFIDFPINSSGVSKKVAEAAYCAGEQGQFWPYHALAFQQQSDLDKDWPLETATNLKLNLDKFRSCLTSLPAREHVQRGQKAGWDLNVRGTPTLFINGRKFDGHDLKAELTEYIAGKAADSNH